MNENLERYYKYYIYDKPVVYKELLIYPATMYDFYNFYWYSTCLLEDKNSIPDPKVISMSYFEFLYYKTDEKNMYLPLFYALMKMVLKKEESRNEKGEPMPFMNIGTLHGKPVFEIDGEIYDANDFDEIKTIIVEQNLLELPDENIQKEIRDKIQEAEKLKQKENKMANLEDQMVYLSQAIHLPLDYIYGLSIRKFRKYLERLDMDIHYKIYLAASMSGFVTFKQKDVIKHPLTEVKKNKMNGLVEMDAVENKLNLNDQKKK